MSDQLKLRIAELARRFDEQLAQFDEAMVAKRAGPPRERVRRTPNDSPWDAIEQRFAEFARFRKGLTREAESARANAKEWETRAVLAVKAGDDSLAREALHRSKEQIEAAAELDAQLSRVDSVLCELQAGADELRRAPE